MRSVWLVCSCDTPRLPLPMAVKVLASEDRVQLIVFFGAIREILKKEIYGVDKQNLRRDENKSRVPAQRRRQALSCKFERFGL